MIITLDKTQTECYYIEPKGGMRMKLIFFALSVQTKQLILSLAVILAAAYVLGILINLPFALRESRMIDIEIGRTEGKEQAYYKKKKRRLWISLVSFIRYK